VFDPPFEQRAVTEQKQGVAMATLERTIQVVMADRKGKMDDEDKMVCIKHVVASMTVFKSSMVAQAIGACALASLTHSQKPYPRRLQQAAVDVTPRPRPHPRPRSARATPAQRPRNAHTTSA
jgi:hypothetical protein